ncbi:hypothetical protein EVA_06120 [gut metagenome]|uniref:Uncharacterized protein n=1 Tax=gut metagenome TaxID=749906 RepID=J9CZQ7_9ZZZZ
MAFKPPLLKLSHKVGIVQNNSLRGIFLSRIRQVSLRGC